MTNEEILLSALRSLGVSDARGLRERASGMDGTAIIAEEGKIPPWDNGKDYSRWPVGGPVQYDGQVYTLLQPHNAAHSPGSTPANTPALWSITHTTDPARAKPWAAPSGTSGLYMTGECCTDPEADDPAAVYRSKVDSNEFSPSARPESWERVEMG